MPWTAYAKDRFLAPKLSQLTEFTAPALQARPESSAGWLAGFVLTSALRVNIPDPARQLMFTYLRRVDTAVLEYTRGREALEAFVRGRDEAGISKYSRCLHAFESTASAAFQAYQLTRQLLPDEPPLFERRDGSELYRLDRIYNAIKHADEWIANGRRFAPESTLTVWIVNAGLECREGVVTFQELADEIGTLGRIAEGLATLDPSPTPAPADDDSNPPAA